VQYCSSDVSHYHSIHLLLLMCTLLLRPFHQLLDFHVALLLTYIFRFLTCSWENLVSSRLPAASIDPYAAGKRLGARMNLFRGKLGSYSLVGCMFARRGEAAAAVALLLQFLVLTDAAVALCD
jgi:hypothetical protein